MDTLRTIKLYGKLGALFGREHRLAVNSPAEAVRALCAMKPGFEKFLMEAKDNGFGFVVLAGNRQLREEQLRDLTGNDPIRIAPMVLGGKAGVVQVILGVVLIVVGALIQWFVFDGAPNPISNYLYGMGISMIVGGIIQMLSPHPKGKSSGDSADSTPSYAFNGSVNTMAQGYPVPIAYGEGFWGSAVISAGILAQDGMIVPTTTGIGGGGVGSGGGGGGANRTSMSSF